MSIIGKIADTVGNIVDTVVPGPIGDAIGGKISQIGDQADNITGTIFPGQAGIGSIAESVAGGGLAGNLGNIFGQMTQGKSINGTSGNDTLNGTFGPDRINAGPATTSSTPASATTACSAATARTA